MTMPSKPILISTMSVTPLATQRSNSPCFIGREALAMSGVEGPMPAQKAWMPPPVPKDSTRGAEPPEVRAKFSATRVAKGKTVDEPAAQMPARAFWLPGAPPSLSPQAASATRAAAQAVNFRERIIGRTSPDVS
ncbi:hypothetical protein D3C81_1932770 [compost metagenome]